MSGRFSYYLRCVFSRDFPALAQMKIRNARRRSKLSFLQKLAPFPVPSSTSKNVSVHILTSHHEWREALWTIRSFFTELGCALPVIFHDDGSLRAVDISAIQTAFPGLQILRRSDADALAKEKLSAFPQCQELRNQCIMAVKLIDPWLTGTDDVILLDSDVLWFSHPVELTQWLASPRTVNRWNRDIESRYSVSPAQIKERFNLTIQARINAGIGFIARRSMDFGALEEFLAFEKSDRNLWLVEQTAYAYLSSRYGVDLLPATYALGTPIGIPPVNSLKSKHYVGAIRQSFYDEGVVELTRRWKHLQLR